ncbi:histone H2A-like [Cetorhinus maximus]
MLNNLVIPCKSLALENIGTGTTDWKARDKAKSTHPGPDCSSLWVKFTVSRERGTMLIMWVPEPRSNRLLCSSICPLTPAGWLEKRSPNNKKSRIVPGDQQLHFRNHQELNKLLGGVTIAQGGGAA